MSETIDQTQVHQLRRLIEISRELASTFDLDTLLNQIVAAATDLCDATAASILLYDSKKGELFFQATTNIEDHFMRGLKVPVDGSLAGWVLTHQKPLLIEDPQSDPRFYPRVERATQFDTESILGVPLITKDTVVGVLQALNKTTGAFTLQDQDTLMTLADHAALAIENTRLFHQSDLMAEMVHELRTPLGSLNAATYLLQRDDVSQEQRKKMVTVIQSETQRLSDLATAFLDLSRLESGRMQFQPERFDPQALAREALAVARSSMLERQIDLTNQLDDSPKMRGDRAKIKQVMLNLLSNAVKYSPEQGNISVVLEVADSHWSLIIKDQGPGIPAESMDLLFDKFYRVPGSEKIAAGTGLGLSICKKIVEAHGGEISVVSELGQGATFRFSLPYESAL
jgi:signal transduction histidine kinase